MRLIDADKLEEKIDDISRGYTSVYGVEEDDIYNAETVEAIPVDWLENFLREEYNKGFKSDALLVAYGIIILCKWKEEANG